MLGYSLLYLIVIVIVIVLMIVIGLVKWSEAPPAGIMSQTSSRPGGHGHGQECDAALVLLYFILVLRLFWRFLLEMIQPWVRDSSETAHAGAPPHRHTLEHSTAGGDLVV